MDGPSKNLTELDLAQADKAEADNEAEAEDRRNAGEDPTNSSIPCQRMDCATTLMTPHAYPECVQGSSWVKYDGFIETYTVDALMPYCTGVRCQPNAS